MRTLLSILFLSALLSSQDPPLKLVADVPLSGPAVRFDYQFFDPSQSRLYIAHMNANQLVVFDVSKREIFATLDGFPDVHGVWAVPELNRVYASATGKHQLNIVDASTLKTIASAGPITYPDGIGYAPSAKRIFVSDEHGNAEAVIDAVTNQFITSIPLGGGAGNTVYDPASGHIFVAVHEKNDLAAIDPASLKIIARYPLPGVQSPHGIALDAENRLAFIAGEENHKLAVFHLSSMKVLAVHDVGEDPDVLAFDPALKLLYVSAESGNISVFREKNKSLDLAGKLFLPHGHTVAVDPATHLVYFPLEKLNGHPILRIMSPAEVK